MTQISIALLPIFSLILMGYVFRKLSFPGENFWPLADKLTYYVLMPALLIYKLSLAPDIGADSINLILTGFLATLLLLALLVILNFALKFDGPSFTSIVQGGIRFNTYILFAIVSSLFGDQGLVIIMVFITFMIPFLNIVCISIFSLYVAKNQLSFKSISRSIVTNPLIIACVIGGMINVLDLTLPAILEKQLQILSEAALPLGLLSVGVGLHFNEILGAKFELALAAIAKLVLYPIIMFLVGSLFELGELELNMVLLFAAMPTAVSSYILARQLGGNLNLMSTTITLQTLLSLASIAIVLQFML